LQLKIRKTFKLPPFIILEGKGNDAPILSRTQMISLQGIPPSAYVVRMQEKTLRVSYQIIKQ